MATTTDSITPPQFEDEAFNKLFQQLQRAAAATSDQQVRVLDSLSEQVKKLADERRKS